MAKVYIDFDSTLYNTDKARGFDHVLEKEICKVTKLSMEESIKAVDFATQNSSTRKIYDICNVLEKKFNLEPNCLIRKIEEYLSNGEDLVYEDSIPFLKRLAQHGHKINILTYTNKEFDYQMAKLYGSKIYNFVDNIIMCSDPKGELCLDYENGVFIDDNPKELESLFDAGVSEDRLIRIVRSGTKYSKIEISRFNPRMIESLDEIENL